MVMTSEVASVLTNGVRAPSVVGYHNILHRAGNITKKRKR